MTVFTTTACLALLMGSTTSSFGQATGRTLPKSGDRVVTGITNPYASVEWKTVGYYDANLHTHTNFSDGAYDPHYAIDTYHQLGYTILALTDHDSHHYTFWPKALYPWTELNDIYHQIKDQTGGRRDKPYSEVVKEEWQNRDPEQLGMVSIPGSEISRTHHLGSLFNHYAGGTTSEETAFMEIGKQGGLALFFHPGRYDRDAEWYVDFYQRHDHVVGMEVYNQVDRYPVDRNKWDSVLHLLMPERPVWGFANDDTHSDNHFGRNRNIFLLSDFTKENVFQAMKKGNFLFFSPVVQGTPSEVKLKGVKVDKKGIQLELAGDFDRIEWITYNPDTGESQIIGHKPGISVRSIPSYAHFVRAVIVSDAGRLYTQPFGLQTGQQAKATGSGTRKLSRARR